MIISREYKPKSEDLIYHYCDANTFYSICTNKKIWFNDLFSTNDYLEMHWGYSIWEKAATRLLQEVGKDFLDKTDEIIHSAGFKGLLIASCFSLNGDVLSQWRAYTNNGNGYAIGFLAEDLIKLPVRPLKVLYEEEKQIKESANAIKTLYKIFKSTSEDEKNSFNELAFLFGYDLSAFKNPAFSEEQEIRLIHLLDFEPSNGFLKLFDAGGTYFGMEKEGEEIKYRIKQNIPTPYIELDFTNKGLINPIKEVIIGPKNDVLPSAISIFLETLQIPKVKIKKSKASYR
jgi:hypothetical protein